MENERQDQYTPPSAMPPRQGNSSCWTTAAIGLGVGCLAVVAIIAVLTAILFPVFSKAREKARQSSCMANMKQLCLTSMMYANDHNGKLPDANKWNDQLFPYCMSKSVFCCVSAGSTVPGYAMNSMTSGYTINSVKSPPSTVLLFDSNPGVNKSGGPGDLPASPRHPWGNNFGFVDGHVQCVTGASIGGMNWDPKKPVLTAP